MTKIQRIRDLFYRISTVSTLVLKLGLCAVALQASILAIVVHDTMQHNPYLVPLYYPPTLEYIALSFTLILGGAILFDILEKADRN
jgi:hypothetical protein